MGEERTEVAEITVLIIDEHAGVRGLLARRLNATPPFRVVAHTGNPLLGTELAWFWEPDIILIDLKGMGRQSAGMYQRIARASPASRLVVFTSYLLDGEEREYLAAGASRCLLKGIALKTLVDELLSLSQTAAKAVPR